MQAVKNGGVSKTLEVRSLRDSLLCLKERLDKDDMLFLAISRNLFMAISKNMAHDDGKAFESRIVGMVRDYREGLVCIHFELIALLAELKRHAPGVAVGEPSHRVPIAPVEPSCDGCFLEGVSLLASNMDALDSYKDSISDTLSSLLGISADLLNGMRARSQ